MSSLRRLKTSQKRDIEDLLDRSGWRIVEKATSPGLWWLDERWVLESEWSPRGATAYVSFLVDPQAPPDRKAGEYVWAVAITRHEPPDWLDATPSVGLGRHWKKSQVPELAAIIGALRSGQA